MVSALFKIAFSDKVTSNLREREGMWRGMEGEGGYGETVGREGGREGGKV